MSAPDGDGVTTGAPGWSGCDLRLALALACLAFVAYNANLRLVSAGDNYPARYLPFSLLRHHRLYLDPIENCAARGDPRPYWILHRSGHAVSTYPVVVPVLLSPLYVPATLWLAATGWTEPKLDRVARLMEKVCASLIASCSVALLYFLLRRRAGAWLAVLLTVAYAFGTNTWMIGSQALWQHGMGELLVVGAMCALTGSSTRRNAWLAGTLCGLIACNRPPDALLALALGLYGLTWGRRYWPWLAAGAALPVGLQLAYNVLVVHHLAGGYADKGDLSSFQYGLLPGILGLLFSPARGLFVFTPFLLFLPCRLGRVLRDERYRRLDLLLLLAIAAQVLLYAKLDWRAGCSWGPRWLTDILPLLVWMLVPVLSRESKAGLAGFAVLTCFSIAVQAIGAFWYTGKSDELIVGTTRDLNRAPALWELRSAPFLLELRHPPAPRGLMTTAEGFIDTLKVAGELVDRVRTGTPLEVEGWALTDGAPPAEVRISLTPAGKTKWRPRGTYPWVSTTSFFERPDVNRTMHSEGASGWRVVLPTAGLDPGEHLCHVAARAGDGGEFLPATARPVMVLADDSTPERASTDAGAAALQVPSESELAACARRAAERIRGGQQPDGAWLTAVTPAVRYLAPARERNTFLVSMMVDLLGPVAGSTGLTASVSGAVRYLRDQIEPTGLVRYRGRPDTITPGLSSLITPDADDTALAWRIAKPAGGTSAERVLRVLNAYRTPQGLYRTWLAPREEYVGIDPGRDPNPADAGIQMHVLMFLDQVDRPAAQALFSRLQPRLGDDSLWVYYAQAPLIPLLREGELLRMGYPLRLPPARTITSVPAQQAWVKLCRELAPRLAGEVLRPAREQAEPLLARLAKDDFAAIRQNPPLLYHNDLTARVRCYYWSVEFGYSLWLRLHRESTSPKARALPETQ